MLSIEERETIEYIKSRLYGNELRIFLNLVEKLQKDFTLKNHKICNLEFIIEKQFKEMKRHIDLDNECEKALNSKIMNLEKEIQDRDKKLQDKAKELIFEKQELTSTLLDSTPNDKIKAKIEVLEKLQKEFPNNDEIRIKIIAYKELLEKE